jgi:hypothetical protein
MKALSVRQPHASLIEAGKKTLEIRTRRTHHRGPLLICASLSNANKEGDGLPKGVALCIVDVVDCRPMTEADVDAACVNPWTMQGASAVEGRQLGAGEPARKEYFAWVLKNPRPVTQRQVKGNTGLFNVEVSPTGS